MEQKRSIFLPARLEKVVICWESVVGNVGRGEENSGECKKCGNQKRPNRVIVLVNREEKFSYEISRQSFCHERLRI